MNLLINGFASSALALQTAIKNFRDEHRATGRETIIPIAFITCLADACGIEIGLTEDEWERFTIALNCVSRGQYRFLDSCGEGEQILMCAGAWFWFLEFPLLELPHQLYLPREYYNLACSSVPNDKQHVELWSLILAEVCVAANDVPILI